MTLSAFFSKINWLFWKLDLILTDYLYNQSTKKGGRNDYKSGHIL